MVTIKTSPVYSRILENHGKRTQILQGGTSSTKTWSIIQHLMGLAQSYPGKLVISVVAETGPALRRGAMRDFFDILGDAYVPQNHNKSEMSYTVNKSIFEFFSADQPHKVRGARRDILFINECNNVRKAAFDEMEVRTRRKIFLDYNPVAEFWAHELIEDKDIVSFDISTYRDNPFLDKSIVKSIESRREKDPNWWNVYGLGQIGMAEGLIIPRFELIDELPKGLETECGLDFGFTNDPSCLLEVGIKGDDMYVNELLYGRGLTNQDICGKMSGIGIPKEYMIYADAAEPKSIEEISRDGWYIKPGYKGADAFNIGIDYILRYNVKVTKSSVNVIKDFRNAYWEQDKNENFINKAAKGFLHSIDAVRYALTGRIKPPSVIVGGR